MSLFSCCPSFFEMGLFIGLELVSGLFCLLPTPRREIAVHATTHGFFFFSVLYVPSTGSPMCTASTSPRWLSTQPCKIDLQQVLASPEVACATFSHVGQPPHQLSPSRARGEVPLVLGSFPPLFSERSLTSASTHTVWEGMCRMAARLAWPCLQALSVEYVFLALWCCGH